MTFRPPSGGVANGVPLAPTWESQCCFTYNSMPKRSVCEIFWGQMNQSPYYRDPRPFLVWGSDSDSVSALAKFIEYLCTGTPQVRDAAAMLRYLVGDELAPDRALALMSLGERDHRALGLLDGETALWTQDWRNLFREIANDCIARAPRGRTARKSTAAPTQDWPAQPAKAVAEPQARAELRESESETRTTQSSSGDSRFRDATVAIVHLLLAATLGLVALARFSAGASNFNWDASEDRRILISASAFIIWLYLYYGRLTVKCPSCKEARRQGNKSFNARKWSLRYKPIDEPVGVANGTRVAYDHHVAQTDFWTANGRPAGHSSTSYTTSRTQPTRTVYYLRHRWCPDCGFHWTTPGSRTFDI